MPIELGELTWPEARSAAERGAVIVVPVGSLEQHGPHLPLETDWRLASEIARRACALAQEHGVPALVTPPVWTGFSLAHMDFAGTISLDAEVFFHLAVQVCQSVSRHGFHKIVLLNGHGGNMHVLRSAVQHLRFAHGIRAIAVNYWDLAVSFINEWRRSEIGGINHACEMETSLMLALRAELVHMDRIRPRPVRERSRYFSTDLTVAGAAVSAGVFSEVSPDGVVGSPELGDRARGEVLLAELVRRVADFLAEAWGAQGPGGRQD